MVAQHDERDAIEGDRIDYGSTSCLIGDGTNTTEQKPLIDIDNDSSNACETCTTDNAVAAPLHTPIFLQEKELLQDEIAGMAKLAIPVILTYLLEQLPSLITIVLVGRVENIHEDSSSMQKLHLDAAALAVMFTNVVALSPAFGILTAMDTLCSQAFGADQSSKMGTYSLTGFAVVSTIFLISSTIILNASSILIALGQPVEVSQMAGEFIRWYMLGVPFLYLYELIRKVFQSRNEAMPMLVSVAVSIVINVALGYHLVRYTTWGWMGAAVARSVGNFFMVPTVFICISLGMGGGESGDEKINESSANQSMNNDGWETQQYLEVDGKTKENDGSDDEKSENDFDFLHHIWEGFVISEALSPKAFMEFLALGFPGMLQVMFEWCAFEVLALLCGILPGEEAVIAIGANSLIMQVSSLTYMLCLGASVAGNVRVGNALGAGDVHRAEIASNLTFASGVIMSMINVTFLLSLRKVLPWFFTTDLEIGHEAEELFLIAAAFQLPDALNACCQGIFRGSGRQALAAIYNFIAYYIIGLPLGYILGIKFGWGAEGLWWGICIGLCSIAIGCTIIILRSDWRKLAMDATSRLNR